MHNELRDHHEPLDLRFGPLDLMPIALFIVEDAAPFLDGVHERLKKNPIAIAIHRARKDIGAVLFIGIPLLLIIVIGIAHTLNVIIYFGGLFLLKLAIPALIITLSVLLVVQKNVVHSLLCLIGVFLCVTCIYFWIGAGYFALVFLLVGQGGVAVIFLHAVLFLPLRATLVKNSVISTPAQKGAVALGAIAFFYTLVALSTAFMQFFYRNDMILARLEPHSIDRLRHFVNFELNDILIFLKLYGPESGLFILITLVLLTAMLGSIVLATSTVEESFE